MKLTKRVARNLIFPTIVGLGLEKVLSAFGEKKVINLIFHGVVKKDSTEYCPRHIEAGQFEKLLNYFSKNFDIITLDEAFEWKSKGIKPKRNTLTISFDDGYQNNLKIALPLLEKYKIPTTVCVSSLCLQKEIFPMLWHDVIDGMEYYFKGKEYTFCNYQIKNFLDIKTGKHIYDIVKEADYQLRDSELKKLIEEYQLAEKFKNMPEEAWKLMDKDEVIELSKSPYITIASHGHYHYNLGLIDIEKAKWELKYSKEQLENCIEKPVEMFAYPDGDYTLEIKDIATEIGYKMQLAVPYNFKEDVTDSRILNRAGISSTTTYSSNIFFLHNNFRN